MAKRTQERVQFLHDILLSAHVSYWSRETDSKLYVYPDNAESDFYLSIIETGDGDVSVPHVITINTIASGARNFSDYVTGKDDGTAFPPNHYYRQFLGANRTNGEDGDYDAEVADMIVQFGLFGKVIYG